MVLKNAPRGKKPLGRSRLRWEDRIKDFEKMMPEID